MEEDFSGMTFGQAHQMANRHGMKVFVWRGKRYNSMYQTDTAATFNERMARNAAAQRPPAAEVTPAPTLPPATYPARPLAAPPVPVERPIRSLDESMGGGQQHIVAATEPRRFAPLAAALPDGMQYPAGLLHPAGLLPTPLPDQTRMPGRTDGERNTAHSWPAPAGNNRNFDVELQQLLDAIRAKAAQQAAQPKIGRRKRSEEPLIPGSGGPQLW